VLVSDSGSTIAARRHLSVATVDDACEVRWRHERPRGTLAFSAVVAEHVVLGVRHGTPSDTSRSVLLALRPDDGSLVWEHTF
jgi:hypothetical protein